MANRALKDSALPSCHLSALYYLYLLFTVFMFAKEGKVVLKLIKGVNGMSLWHGASIPPPLYKQCMMEDMFCGQGGGENHGYVAM